MLNCSLPCPRNIPPSLFYECILQVPPFTSVSELCNLQSREFPRSRVAVYSPTKPSLYCLCSAKQAQLARNPDVLILMQKLGLAPGAGGIVL